MSGFGVTASNVTHGFYWTQAGGAVDIGVGTAMGISGDGSTVVGYNAARAFRWTLAGGVQDLGLPPGHTESYGYATNLDGSVVVGYEEYQSWAFRWTAAGGMQTLPYPHASGIPFLTFASGVSDDGAMVVGWTGSSSTPYFWTPALGSVYLNEYAAVHGPNLAGWQLITANGVSGDGSVIVGFGYHAGANGTRGWMMRLHGPCGSADFDGDGAVATDADIEAFFACLAGNCCAACGSADFDGDGAVGTDQDVEAFFRVLAGGHC
jgi:uncharacterized membrane protein